MGSCEILFWRIYWCNFGPAQAKNLELSSFFFEKNSWVFSLKKLPYQRMTCFEAIYLHFFSIFVKNHSTLQRKEEGVDFVSSIFFAQKYSQVRIIAKICCYQTKKFQSSSSFWLFCCHYLSLNSQPSISNFSLYFSFIFC